MPNTSQFSVCTSHFVRGHISSLPPGSLFPTRLFLAHGLRSNVDRCLSRLVSDGYIRRIARGVFLKPDIIGKFPAPSIEQVARVKARAFGREIYVHGATAATRLGFHLKPQSVALREIGHMDGAVQTQKVRLQLIHLGYCPPDDDYVAAALPCNPIHGDSLQNSAQSVQRVFAVAGKTTSFMYGKVRITLKGIAAKYLKLGDSIPGLVLRAILHAGKTCDYRLALSASPVLIGRQEMHALRLSAWQFPAWLSDSLCNRKWHRELLNDRCLVC